MIRRIYILAILSVLSIMINAENTYTKTSVLSTGKWVKIRVKDAGVYQFTSSTLKSMGFNNPDNVRLYGYNLPVLPEANIQKLSDDLTEIPLYRSQSGTLLFYSKGTTEWKRKNNYSVDFNHKNNPYSLYTYYFLTEDENVKPAEFRKVDAKTDNSPTQSTYYAHTLYDPDEYSFLNCGRTFFEAYDYATGSIKSYKIPLEGVPTNNISLTVQFGAAGKNTSTLQVKTDSLALGTLTFGALEEYQYAKVSSKSFTVSNINTDNLRITLQHNRQSGTTGHLDYIKACYETDLVLKNNYLVFSANTVGNKTFGIQCEDSTKITCWNITSPANTYELVGSASTANDDKSLKQMYKVYAKACKLNDNFIILDKTAVYPTPERVGNVTNQNLHALEDINLLIIVPTTGKLTEQAKRLASAHEELDGMKCAVVTADQVYNEFSSGTPDVTAYRRLAKMLYDRDNSLQNILLFGACYWDNRMITQGLRSRNPYDYLLVYESENSWSHTDSYAAEEYISLLDDGEGISPLKEKPDAGVGRIPVTTELEAKQVVDKLIAYMNNREAGAWKNTICLMGDDGNSNIHMEDAEQVLKNTQLYYPNFRYKRIYWDSYMRKQSATGNSFPDALNEINRTMEEGALIMNYTGHGAAYCLSHEQVLKTINFANWTTPRLPLWFTAACDVCPFDMNTENLAVTALLNPKGAAMGFVSTARTVYSSPNRTINKNFMKHVLETNPNGERYTIGEALALAKCDIISSKATLSRLDSINKAQYVLMGDPAIRLLTPKYNIKIDKIDTGSNSNGQPIMNAGTTVTISGHVVDENGNEASSYNGMVSPTVFDTKELVKCYGNSNVGSDTIFTYTDHRRTIYSGTDSIRSGKFEFTFSVPLDINYSKENGLLKLYAVNDDHSVEAHGTYSDFYVGSTGDIAINDTIGPNVTAWLNHVAFRNGMHTGTSPILYAQLTDSAGINTTGNGIGHDIEVIIDGKESTTYPINNYFRQTVGDFTSGSITYQIPALEAGYHTLTLRAFDIYNNPGSTTITFYAVDGEETVETFDASGRKLSSSITTVLPPGIYIRRYTVRENNEIIEERTEKFFITK